MGIIQVIVSIGLPFNYRSALLLPRAFDRRTIFSPGNTNISVLYFLSFIYSLLKWKSQKFGDTSQTLLYRVVPRHVGAKCRSYADHIILLPFDLVSPRAGLLVLWLLASTLLQHCYVDATIALFLLPSSWLRHKYLLLLWNRQIELH